MKNFIGNHASRRHTHDGWAVAVEGAESPIWRTVCTTRKEAREIRNKMSRDLFIRTRVVKVRIQVKVIN